MGTINNELHGMSRTRFYMCWKGMKKRTTEGGSKQQGHPCYVGVERCPEWDEFIPFRDAMLDTYFDGAVLARFGDKGRYEPGNVRWVTKEENLREANEPRMLRMVDGRFAKDVARENGISVKCFDARIHRGWTPDRAATWTCAR